MCTCPQEQIIVVKPHQLSIIHLIFHDDDIHKIVLTYFGKYNYIILHSVLVLNRQNFTEYL